MKRHRAVLLNRETEYLLELLRGVKWGDYVTTERASDFELGDYIFRLRVGCFLGQSKIALISQGQFIAMKSITMDGAIWNLFHQYRDDVLNPRKPPHGIDAGWYHLYGPAKEVTTVLGSLIIEENQ